jgi:hypothetical protein
MRAAMGGGSANSAGGWRGYAKLLAALRRFCSETWTVEAARAEVAHALERRERSFLSAVERTVYDVPRSPYRQLLAYAGCTFGDLRSLVEARGLEAALAALREAGVYVRWQELEGKEPITRGSFRLEVAPSDFDNPLDAGVALALDHLAALSARELLALAAHGVDRAPHALWRGASPAVAGLDAALRLARMGNPPERWFGAPPVAASDDQLAGISSARMVTAARLCGARLPRPERTPTDGDEAVVAWARDAVGRAGRAAISCTVRRAVSLTEAAGARAAGLAGVTFLAGGEPARAVHATALRACGARLLAAYPFFLGGAVALGCARTEADGDLHVPTDLVALVPFERARSSGREPARALLLTTLTLSAPRILFNAESSDDGVVETRDCGCPLGSLGYATHLTGIARLGSRPVAVPG